MDQSEYQSFSELFPMPMTSIEKFHWFDSSPEYPNVVFCRMRISSRLDPAIAKDAWQYAIQRQPFGDVSVERIRGKLCWAQGPRGHGKDSIEEWHGTKFEFQTLEVEPQPWRFQDHSIQSLTGSYLGITEWPTESPADSQAKTWTTEIWLYVHHAVGDGIGSINVINDWMIIYSNLANQRSPLQGLFKLDKRLLKKRNSLGLTSWRYLKHLWMQPIAIFGATKFLLRKTPLLTTHQIPNTENKTQAPRILGRWIPEHLTREIDDEAKLHNVMTNSVLMGKLYVAIARWRAKFSNHQSNDWLRLILPISIRNISDRRLPTANRATIVQIDRRELETQDRRELYFGIDREIKIIKKFQLDKIFLILIRLFSVREKWLKNAAQDKKSRGMVVFTNLGEPLRRSERAGRKETSLSCVIRPTEFDLVGPIRKGTPVNVTIARYAERIRVSLQYDHRVLTSDQAEALLDGYVSELTSH